MGISASSMRKAYGYSLKRVRKRLVAGRPVRVGFAVVFDSVFPMAPVFRLMLKNKLFAPFLVPIPGVNKGSEFERHLFNQTFNSLKKCFPEAQILNPYDRDEGYRDIAEECDLYCTANPYDQLTLPIFSIKHFWKRHIPVFYAHYGTPISQANENFLKTNACFGRLWRIYAENKWMRDCLALNPHNPEVVISGSPKMDALALQPMRPNARKCVIIGLHHSIKNGLCSINFGTFLDYSDFYLSLPERFPDIDFEFRPHQLLFPSLERDDIWGKQKSENYWQKIKSFPNATLHPTGDFYSLFANSDALIHDCGSFTAEYLYTGKPCCKIIPKSESSELEYGEFGRRCLNVHYKANSPQDIINFIKNVIIDENDPLNEERKAWLPNVAMNYPHAAEFILDDIKRSILNS